MLDDKAARKH